MSKEKTTKLISKQIKDFIDDFDKINKEFGDKTNSFKNTKVSKIKKMKETNNCICCMFLDTEECNLCPYNSPINRCVK